MYLKRDGGFRGTTGKVGWVGKGSRSLVYGRRQRYLVSTVKILKFPYLASHVRKHCPTRETITLSLS